MSDFHPCSRQASGWSACGRGARDRAFQSDGEAAPTNPGPEQGRRPGKGPALGSRAVRGRTAREERRAGRAVPRKKKTDLLLVCEWRLVAVASDAESHVYSNTYSDLMKCLIQSSILIHPNDLICFFGIEIACCMCSPVSRL